MRLPHPSASPEGPSGSWELGWLTFCGAVNIVIGFTVLAGWHWHKTILIQIAPTLAPMHCFGLYLVRLGGAALCSREKLGTTLWTGCSCVGLADIAGIHLQI